MAQELREVVLGVRNLLHGLLMDVIAYNLKSDSVGDLAEIKEFEITLEEVVALRLMSGSIQRKIVELVFDRPFGADAVGFPLMVSLMARLKEFDHPHLRSDTVSFGDVMPVLARVKDFLYEDQQLLIRAAIRPDQLLSSRLPVHFSAYTQTALDLVEVFADMISPRPRFEITWNGDVMDLTRILEGFIEGE